MVMLSFKKNQSVIRSFAEPKKRRVSFLLSLTNTSLMINLLNNEKSTELMEISVPVIPCIFLVVKSTNLF